MHRRCIINSRNSYQQSVWMSLISPYQNLQEFYYTTICNPSTMTLLDFLRHYTKLFVGVARENTLYCGLSAKRSRYVTGYVILYYRREKKKRISPKHPYSISELLLPLTAIVLVSTIILCWTEATDSAERDRSNSSVQDEKTIISASYKDH